VGEVAGLGPDPATALADDLEAGHVGKLKRFVAEILNCWAEEDL
jgi:hypothetical protein